MAVSVRRALLVAWLVASAALLPVAAAPWLFPERVLEAAAARCRLEHPGGRPCALCGMTRAFVRIGERDWEGARRANPAAVPLYFLLALNELVVTGVVIFRRRN